MKIKPADILAVFACIAIGLTGCSTTEQAAIKNAIRTAQTDINNFNAWCASPTVSTDIKTGELLAGKIVGTVAAFDGNTNTQNELYGAQKILSAYGDQTIPVNVITSTVAAAPTLATVILPLTKTGNNPAALAIVNGLIADLQTTATPATSGT